MRSVSTHETGGMKKVMVFGTFDIVHAGHLYLFQQARKLGDYLIAVVARDVNVKKIKGNAPLHTEHERKYFLEHIDFIDRAVLGGLIDVRDAIRKLQPDIIALGYDQKAFVDEVKKYIKESGRTVKIVRLKPYKAHRYKTGKMKNYLDRQV